jgi:uncharacterized protein (DUF924 family)
MSPRTDLVGDVLGFWFGDDTDEGAVLAQGRERWFAKNDALDAQIAERFRAEVAAARLGKFDPLAERPEGRLALLILIDQFSRNLGRGEASAYDADDHAQRLCLDGLRLGHDRALTRPQRLFFYLPLEHAENLSLQHASVALFAMLAEEAPAAERAHYDNARDYAERHHAVIARFGRFPHRNAVLGRVDSADEADYLSQPGAGF